MDLDHLITREGEERLRAAAASCERSRDAHARLADLFRDRISNHLCLAAADSALSPISGEWFGRPRTSTPSVANRISAYRTVLPGSSSTCRNRNCNW